MIFTQTAPRFVPGWNAWYFIIIYLQALTTGTIPGFIDVVLNLNSHELTEDNLISQMHSHGKTILFYGDDTWMRLFPGHFAEADGTTSFFVTDYTEVSICPTK